MADSKARAIGAPRFLATKLGNVASALEDGKHPGHDKGRMARISRMAKADLGLAHPREDTEDNRIRDHFFETCRTMGAVLGEQVRRAPERRAELEAQVGRKLPDDFPWVHPHALENMSTMAINVFLLAAPEHQRRVSALEGDARKLVHAYAKKAGASRRCASASVRNSGGRRVVTRRGRRGVA